MAFFRDFSRIFGRFSGPRKSLTFWNPEITPPKKVVSRASDFPMNDISKVVIRDVVETEVNVIEVESLSESSDIENLCKVPRYLMGAHHFRLSSLNVTLASAMSVNVRR